MSDVSIVNRHCLTSPLCQLQNGPIFVFSPPTRISEEVKDMYEYRGSYQGFNIAPIAVLIPVSENDPVEGDLQCVRSERINWAFGIFIRHDREIELQDDSSVLSRQPFRRCDPRSRRTDPGNLGMCRIFGECLYICIQNIYIICQSEVMISIKRSGPPSLGNFMRYRTLRPINNDSSTND